jgi:hypothetical protein
MKFRAYQRPHLVGWLGWFEDDDGRCFGFLGLDNRFRWWCGVPSVPCNDAEVREAEQRMASEPPVELPERLKIPPGMPVPSEGT